MALKFDPKKSALIIQDLQNDVIMPGGAFTKRDPAPAEHAKSQNVVAQRQGARHRGARGGRCPWCTSGTSSRRARPG